MALLSRSFIRKRAISLATTLSLSATSFALARDPSDGEQLLTGDAKAKEQQFLFDNDLAMSGMTRQMLVKPTGDVARDFVTVMIPHHQGAIDMARAKLKYDHNEPPRSLAQNIITQREHEISVMQSAFGEPSQTPSDWAPGPQRGEQWKSEHPSAAMNSMNMN